MVETAELLYDQLGAIGWTHTPDPRDVPSKHILRLRREGVDCLFGVYTLIEGSAATAAQRAVRINYFFAASVLRVTPIRCSAICSMPSKLRPCSIWMV